MSFEDSLINLIQKYPHLYDKSDKSYKDGAKSDSSWKEMATTLELPVDKVKARWQTLRQKFSREVKLMKSNSTSPGALKKRRWQYLDSLMFLREHMANGDIPNITKPIHMELVLCKEEAPAGTVEEASIGLSNLMTTNGVTSVTDEEFNDVSFLQSTSLRGSNDSQMSGSISSRHGSRHSTSYSYHSPTPSAKKAKRQAASGSEMTQLLSATTSLLNSAMAAVSSKTMLDTFGEYVAKVLSSLNEERMLATKRSIQVLLLEAEEEYLRERREKL